MRKFTFSFKTLLLLASMLIGGGNYAWAANIVVSWAVSSAPTGGSPFQVKSSDNLEDVLQVAFGTPKSGDAWSVTSSDAVTTVSYSGKNYNFAKYAQTSDTNGSSSSSLAANGSSEYNYITFVPKYDGTVVVVGHNLGTNNAEKPTWCYEDGVVKSGVIIGSGSSNIAYDGKTDVYTLNGGQLTGGIKFTVKGGSTYTLSIQGSKARWCGVIYDYVDPWNTLYNKALSDWKDADLTDWVAGSTYSRTTSSIDKDNGLKVVATGTSSAKTETYTFTKTISVRNKSSLILDLQWYANNPNGNSQYSYITFGDIRIRFSSQNGNMWIKFGDNDEQQLITNAGTGLRGATWNVNFIVDQYLHTVNYSIASSKYDSGTAITGSGTSSATFNNVVLGYKGGYNYDYVQSIKSITIKESAKVGYTINYTYGGEIIASEEGTEYKGETVNASKTYVWNEGNTQKYYVSGEATTSFVVNDNASSNVFEVALREAETWNYTVNCVDGSSNILKTLVSSGSVVEGETAATFYYPQYLKEGNILYSTTKSQGGGDYYKYTNYVPTANNEIKNIAYSNASVSNLLFFSEGEDIAGATASSAYNTDIRCSMGQLGYFSSTTNVFTLPAGTYKIHTQVWGNKDTNITFTAGENSYIHTTTGALNEKTSEDITITETTTVTVSGGVNGKGLDWVYITGTPAYEVVGATDCSTGYLDDMTEKITLSPGESYKYKFINYNSNGSDNSKNWVLPVYASGADEPTITLRADRWEDKAWSASGFEFYSKGSDDVWADFINQMNGATVDMTISYSNTRVVNVACDIITKSGYEWVYNYTSDYTGSTRTFAGNIDIAISVSLSWLEVLAQGKIFTPQSSANLEGWKTFYNADANYEVDANTTIYKASAYTAGKSVTLTPVAGKIVPKNTPVVLKTTDAGYNITLTPTASDSEDDFTGNLLGVYDGTSWSKDAGDFDVVYMLGYTESEKFGLYLYTATPDEGDIAVLVPSGGTAKKVSLVVDGEATEVVAPEVAEVDEEEVLFNMAGIQVDKNFKGIVINQKGVKRFNR